jgi:HPt (histidine-containing phosphotransfer) domain-containing protein
MDSNGFDTIVVEIDLELITVVPDYLENRRLDCQSIERLLADGDLDGIRALAHRMKGSGGSYGFDEITTLGEALERAALVPDSNGIRSVVSRLKSYLSSVSVTYI